MDGRSSRSGRRIMQERDDQDVDELASQLSRNTGISESDSQGTDWGSSGKVFRRLVRVSSTPLSLP